MPATLRLVAETGQVFTVSTSGAGLCSSAEGGGQPTMPLNSCRSADRWGFTWPATGDCTWLASKTDIIESAYLAQPYN
ncbi:MAG: hypothetical protein JKY34_12430 [Kordiimonadaceae bacterium]|nr:hypothetical protein [Kordiimonadaceae bacterium]